MNIRRMAIKSEQGIISILTTTVFMVVISLIVLGFAQIVNRNQRSSVDEQLSTQAFYAAESGINDVLQLINNRLSTDSTFKVPAKTDCTSGDVFYALNPDINTGTGVKYTCVLVNPTPTILRYGNITTTSSVIPISPADGSVVGTLKLEWKAKNNTTPLNNCVSSLAIPTSNSWGCGYGLMRIDLVPTAGALSVDGLRNSTTTIFAFPFSGGSSSASSSVVQGVHCTNTSCILNIGNLTSNSYYLRVMSLYKDVSLEVSAGGKSLSGAQAVIDATGKAQDVLRRVQVSVPLVFGSQNAYPDYAIQTNDSICKRFSVSNGYYLNDMPGSGSGIFCQ